MVPPPDNAAMEFPDFDKMTPEEQMAWLESLARRQGANDAEFTTAADLEIAVPEDVVIDEPGYVPFFERERSSRAPVQDTPVDEPVNEQIQAPEPEISEAPETPVLAEQPLLTSAESAEVGEPEAADPMRWLDSFTPHSEDAFGDLELDLDLELGAIEEFDLGDLELLNLEPPEPVQSAVPARDEPEVARPEVVEPGAELESIGEFDFDSLFGEAETATQPSADAVDDEFLSGIDPMRWLESLAVRQGASSEELTTAADLEIPELPDDTVIDEPGYVPYDATDGTREPDSVRRLASETDVVSESQSGSGIHETEPPDAEQDYGMYAPTGSAAHDMISAEPPSTPEFFEDELARSLAWMDELTGAPEPEDFAAMIDLEKDILGTQTPEARQAEQGESTAAPEAVIEDPLAGLTDEEILDLQVRGELTGEQELLWLQRQAEKLAEARQLEDAGPAPTEDELAEAEPAVLPDWLEEMRGEAEQQEVEASELLEGELFEARELEGLPDWLTPPDVLPVVASEVGPELESLWGEKTSAEPPLEGPTEISASDIDMFLSETYATEPDALADALDAEYERQLSGDESEPEWYREAVSENGVVEAGPEAAQAAPDPEAASDLQPAIPVDLPDWLKDNADAEDSEPADAAPEWVAELEGEPERAEADSAPEWLEAPETWAEPIEPTPRPEAPARVRQASIPASPQFEQYRNRLDQDPSDHPSRLSLARALKSSGEPVASLDHYEVLVESNALLPDVSEDLNNLASQQQEDTRVHRLRGDTYMRRGMLQEALDAYRTALEQL